MEVEAHDSFMSPRLGTKKQGKISKVGELMHYRDWPADSEVVSECLILACPRDLDIIAGTCSTHSQEIAFCDTAQQLGQVTRLIGLHFPSSESPHNPHGDYKVQLTFQSSNPSSSYLTSNPPRIPAKLDLVQDFLLHNPHQAHPNSKWS